MDIEIGRRVLKSKLFFEKGEFNYNISPVLKAGPLGTYRGFIKVSSD